jgi:NADH-quinone oxidoreductase subunit J
MVVFSPQPVVSVLSLILCFLNTAGIFLILQAEYVAFSLLIVYIGAVAVLFLFVVMMINIKKSSFKDILRSHKKSFFFLFIFLIIELIMVIWLHKTPLYQDDLSTFAMSTIKAPTNTHALGELIYTFHFISFELSGIALLIAMIGSIILVHEKNNVFKKQNTMQQLMRTKENSLEIVKIKPCIDKKEEEI